MTQKLSGHNNILFDLKQDSHVHTFLCQHATGSMEEYITAALNKGIETLIFLEHLEENISYPQRTWLTESDFSYYFEEGKRLQEKYQDRLTIKMGVEIGFNPHEIDTLRDKIKKYPWEHIGLSYHYYPSDSGHLNVVSRRNRNIDALAAIGAERVITDYFSGIIQGITRLKCDSICHLDAVMRHYPKLRFTPSHFEQIDRILTLLKEKRIALEINTSGFAIRNEPYPGKTILKKAMERNIPLIAGSDAHHPDQVGRYFDRLPDFLDPLR